MNFYKNSQVGRQRGRGAKNLLMGFDQLEEDYEPTATPRLSLSKLPNKQIRESLVMPTPPPSKSLASVPFQWEEAPGKPRSSSSSPSNENKMSAAVARRLDLPPRLLLMNNSNTTDSSSSSCCCNPNFCSPTTVLDGPDHDGQSLCQNSVRSLEEEIIRESKFHQHRHHHHHHHHLYEQQQEEGSLKFSSWRLGSLKDHNWPFARRSSGFTSSASFTSKSQTSSSSKLQRFKRRSSFANLSSASSNFLAGVYGSFKQVVQWRRRPK